jgi:seryl-tRNA synthetase
MAQLIDSKGLEQTIFEVWGNARLLTLEHLQAKHNHLAQAFINYRLQANKQIDSLKKENQSLKTGLDTLTQEFKAYQENNKKKKGLFK